jgi:predicted dehydrogenase
VPSVPGAYQDFYAGIRDALRGGGAPPVAIGEAVAVMAVIEGAQASAREGRVVSL